MRVAAHSVVVCLLVLYAAAGARMANVPVVGKVVDVPGRPVSHALVELWSSGRLVRSVVTDAGGGFTFSSVASGTYEIRVRMKGFEETRASVSVGETPPAPLQLVMRSDTSRGAAKPAPGGVVGGVVGSLPSAPPPVAAPASAAETMAPRRLGGAYGGGGGGVAGSVYPPLNTEAYDRIEDNNFRRVADAPLSTFSIDVDTASYANVRRFLNSGALPPADAVRVEELINYFHFDYADTVKDAPFGITTELAPCPWNRKHSLALIGLQAKKLQPGKTPPRNLVFLIDVSGSMTSADKLPLVKTSMRMLAETLTPADRVAIVVYAGASGLALPSTTGDRAARIQEAIESLTPGGSTNGAAGIQLAYQIATEHFVRDGINRVILATDGDFNVGVTSQGELLRLIEEKRKSGVFLSVLGVGTGNLKDSTMEKLADAGNGNYSYLDSLHEARRVLIAEAGSTLVTVAKDVKIQVEFNPARVGAYRLVGYENRLLKNEDFNNDKKDAGDMGAGHTVTVLYEIVPPGEEVDTAPVDPLRYQTSAQPTRAAHDNELMTVKVRYKNPDGDTSRLLSVAVANTPTPARGNVGFAAGVAEFGMLLRQSGFRADATWEDAARLAREHRGADADGYRAELIRLIDLAAALDRQRTQLPAGGR